MKQLVDGLRKAKEAGFLDDWSDEEIIQAGKLEGDEARELFEAMSPEIQAFIDPSVMEVKPAVLSDDQDFEDHSDQSDELPGVASPKQEVLLSYLISDDTAWGVCNHIIEPEFFEKELQDAVRFIKDYADKYRKLPSPTMIRAETGVSIPKQQDAKDRFQWILDETEKFCRTQKTINTMYDALDDVMKGEVEDLVDRFKEATLLSLNRDLGTNYWHDPKSRLKQMLENNVYPTGFKHLDEALYGGIEKGGVNIVIAGSGVGKSWALANLGMNFVERGKNVIYISLELFEPMLARRFDSLVTGIPYRAIFQRMDEVSDIIRIKAKKSGALWFKYMSSGSTVNDIAAYIKNFEIQTGIKPDVLLVDYLDLLSPKAKIKDLGNLWVKDKYVTEELRSLVKEYDMYCFTASQMTRGAMDQEEHTQSMIAGGISKINTADNVMSLYQSHSMRENGLYMIQLLKTRSSAGVGKKIFITFDLETMRWRDAPDDMNESISTPQTSANASSIPSSAPRSASSILGSNSDRLNRLKSRIQRT